MEKCEMLEKVRSLDCEIVEVICDVTIIRDNKTFENESILIFNVEEPSNEDLINWNNHWTSFNGVADLEDELDDEINGLSNFMYSNFKVVKEFKTDF